MCGEGEAAEATWDAQSVFSLPQVLQKMAFFAHLADDAF